MVTWMIEGLYDNCGQLGVFCNMRFVKIAGYHTRRCGLVKVTFGTVGVVRSRVG